MEINEQLIKLITSKVVEQIRNSSNVHINSTAAVGIKIRETGEAASGQYNDEVVIGLAPAFGVEQTQTIGGLSHAEVLREIAAGVEEEGLKSRFVKVYSTSDVSFIALTAAKLSGSGIGVGLQSKGTAVIHQKDLFPLTNLELFPQAPLITAELYRKIGKNAARYAKGQSPSPITVQSDYMVRPKFQAKAALLHIKETEKVVDGAKPVQLEISFDGQVV